jgi:hypothetical protein
VVIGGADPAGHRQVVEADHAEVLGDAQAGLPGRLVDAEALQVAAGEDGGRRIGQGEQLAALFVAALEVEVAVPDQGRVDA